MIRRVLIVFGAATLLGGAGPARDPDWPCVQRLVPALTAEAVWPGARPTEAWRDDPALSALVAEVAPRARPLAVALSRLDGYIAGQPPRADRVALFAGLTERTNMQRGEVIARLQAVGRRQRSLAEAASRLAGEIQALPADAAPERRAEMVARRQFIIRDYESVDGTIRYACEVPVELEQRLGQFARVLRKGLDE